MIIVIRILSTIACLFCLYMVGRIARGEEELNLDEIIMNIMSGIVIVLGSVFVLGGLYFLISLII